MRMAIGNCEIIFIGSTAHKQDDEHPLACLGTSMLPYVSWNWHS